MYKIYVSVPVKRLIYSASKLDFYKDENTTYLEINNKFGIKIKLNPLVFLNFYCHTEQNNKTFTYSTKHQWYKYLQDLNLVGVEMYYLHVSFYSYKQNFHTIGKVSYSGNHKITQS